jgi:hypothetical protein
MVESSNGLAVGCALFCGCRNRRALKTRRARTTFAIAMISRDWAIVFRDAANDSAVSHKLTKLARRSESGCGIAHSGSGWRRCRCGRRVQAITFSRRGSSEALLAKQKAHAPIQDRRRIKSKDAAFRRGKGQVSDRTASPALEFPIARLEARASSGGGAAPRRLAVARAAGMECNMRPSFPAQPAERSNQKSTYSSRVYLWVFSTVRNALSHQICRDPVPRIGLPRCRPSDNARRRSASLRFRTLLALFHLNTVSNNFSIVRHTLGRYGVR